MIIKISRYPVYMKIGFYPEERLAGQEVYVSLDVKLDSKLSQSSEQLSNTLDYGLILKAIDQVLKDNEVKLLESAICRLGQFLIETYSKILSVRVELEKPILPEHINKGAKISLVADFDRDKLIANNTKG